MSSCVGRVMVFVLAGLLTAACGSPGAALQAPAEASPPCDLRKAMRVLYGDSDSPVPSGQESFLCEKAEPLIADEKRARESLKKEGQVNPAPEPSADYWTEGIWGQEEASGEDVV